MFLYSTVSTLNPAGKRVIHVPNSTWVGCWGQLCDHQTRSQKRTAKTQPELTARQERQQKLTNGWDSGDNFRILYKKKKKHAPKTLLWWDLMLVRFHQFTSTGRHWKWGPLCEIRTTYLRRAWACKELSSFLLRRDRPWEFSSLSSRTAQQSSCLEHRIGRGVSIWIQRKWQNGLRGTFQVSLAIKTNNCPWLPNKRWNGISNT